MNSQRQIDLWNAMLDAEMNEVYWGWEAQRYGATDRVFAASTAMLSSGTLAALFVSFHELGKAVALLASVVSILHATFYHTGRLKQVSALAARWKEIAIDYRLLWSSLKDKKGDDSKVWKDFEAISHREKTIDESGFKANMRKLKLAQKQVCESRGIKHD